MTTKYLNTALVLGAFVFALSGLAARAQVNEAAIQFPVAELGGCGSKEECKTYCDEPANMEACIAFAEKNNLMPQEEVQMAKKFIAAGAKGPGGCTGKDSCESYCNDTSHIDACISFAEEAGMMAPDELAEAKKVQAAIRNGVTPPPCGGKKACDSYCREPQNMPVCITFAKQAGLMSEEEAANADKMLVAIKNGAKPPACGGKEECDAYCSQEENFNECVEFGRAAGFMSEKDYEMAKKTGGKGPGGCRREECETFCENPENQEICFSFAKEHGLISEEDMKRMEEGDKGFRESISNAPPEVAACLKEKLGEEKASQIMSGSVRPSQEIGETMKACFEQVMSQRPQGEQGMQRGPEGQMPPQGSGEDRPMPPEGYQGQMPPEGYRGQMPPEGYQRPPEGTMPPEGYRPPEGMTGPMPYDGQRPPEGYQGQMPPEGYQGQMPPEGYQMPPQEGTMPPPTTESSSSGGGESSGATAPALPASEAGTPTDSGGAAPAPALPASEAGTPTDSGGAAPAPAPTDSGGAAPETSLLSPSSLMAAAINFFRPLFVR
ncbi:hypothetical protein HYV30_01375 [Candidatus Kaiserbacteria bacterium]|nr:hypothetical protein [Candidatus Kaiserbacteria bacterium]